MISVNSIFATILRMHSAPVRWNADLPRHPRSDRRGYDLLPGPSLFTGLPTLDEHVADLLDDGRFEYWVGIERLRFEAVHSRGAVLVIPVGGQTWVAKFDGLLSLRHRCA